MASTSMSTNSLFTDKIQLVEFHSRGVYLSSLLLFDYILVTHGLLQAMGHKFNYQDETYQFNIHSRFDLRDFLSFPKPIISLQNLQEVLIRQTYYQGMLEFGLSIDRFLFLGVSIKEMTK